MYVRRIQLMNYGPIPDLDIQFPFEAERPKPVVLVGENGSGKSIVLSHIVNGLMSAKDSAFPDTPEVETGKVYKLRSGSYIRSGQPYYLAHVQFDQDMSIGEVRTVGNSQEYPDLPSEQWSAELQDLWRKLPEEGNDHYESSFTAPSPFTDDGSRQKIRDMLSNGCVIYLPSDRFEDPAWLNEESLQGKVRRLHASQLSGHTNRRILATSPLRDNCDWLFDVIYDMLTAERQTNWEREQFDQGDQPVLKFRERVTYRGQATASWHAALQVLTEIIGEPDARFVVGARQNRTLSIQTGDGQYLSSVFQLSSGECALLDLFLTILRDADLGGAAMSSPAELQGIVLVDEIDLHLHVVHQRQVLPKLMQMFPKVQFVVTTHSPLFVLGMSSELGEDGFALYRLPEGERIGPEEFSEFGRAYEVFMETRRAQDDVDDAIRESPSPIAFVEGTTDVEYLRKAAELLDRQDVWDVAEVRAGGGKGQLDKVWKAYTSVIKDAVPIRIALIYDCDARGEGERGQDGDASNVARRFIPRQDHNPIRVGIENLFPRETLEWAREQDQELFAVTEEYKVQDGLNDKVVPEGWRLRSDDAKRRLCDMLCDRGEPSDFQAFEGVLQLIVDALHLQESVAGQS